MTLQCSICLSTFKDPVCLPCGHLYCKKCLTDHVNVPANQGLTSNCPDCRATFNIVIPDLSYLPAKYHPFISHAVRRVYIDTSAYTALQKKVRHAEKRLESKNWSEEALLKKCEGLAAARDAHAQGEAEAKQEIIDLEIRIEELDLVQDRCEELEREKVKLQRRSARLSAENQKLKERIEELESKDREVYSLWQEEEGIPYTPRHRSPSFALPDSILTNVYSRPIRPLPSRRRVRVESDSPPPNYTQNQKRARHYA
ncbi:hypothetical protein M413DRAFT_442382 [Hebeloma cylindrosporum]|uniref:RING-type domain-containing protein n=1 Tax=Hebeloma cylindrosporum TaxID=76867 RepID=A0A0C2Y3G0_HEBCY|nr:hypothetical protein M413DRAFT_442382 [Hebeloma cylindrosporum h7]